MVGDKIRWLRWKKRIKQKELAKKAGLSPSVLCNIEQGKRATPEQLKSIANALEINVEELLEV